MKSDVKELVLNGESMDPSTLSTMISALCDPRILAEKGGYVFTLFLEGNRFHLGLTPSIINGERQYHYDLIVAENPGSLTGFINPDGSVELIVKLPKGTTPTKLSNSELTRFHETYVRFARFLVERGFPPDVTLNPCSRMVLEELKLFASPIETMGDLAKQDLNAVIRDKGAP